MKNNIKGKVLNLFIAKDKKRENENQILLDKNGILGDKFYGKNIHRSVLIVSTHSYKLVEHNNIDINYGQLGENILIDYNPYHLKIGTQLKIDEVILEISQKCTLCKSLSKVDHCLSDLLKDDRGIFAKVIQEGEIQKNSEINILDN